MDYTLSDKNRTKAEREQTHNQTKTNNFEGR